MRRVLCLVYWSDSGNIFTRDTILASLFATRPGQWNFPCLHRPNPPTRRALRCQAVAAVDMVAVAVVPMPVVTGGLLVGVDMLHVCSECNRYYLKSRGRSHWRLYQPSNASNGLKPDLNKKCAQKHPKQTPDSVPSSCPPIRTQNAERRRITEFLQNSSGQCTFEGLMLQIAHLDFGPLFCTHDDVAGNAPAVRIIRQSCLQHSALA